MVFVLYARIVMSPDSKSTSDHLRLNISPLLIPVSSAQIMIPRKCARSSVQNARRRASSSRLMIRSRELSSPGLISDSPCVKGFLMIHPLATEYRDGRKIAGLRSKYDFEHRLKPLEDFFGKKKLRSLTHGDLQRYKTQRLKTPVISGRNTRKTKEEGKPKSRPRSIATVHRELSFMRRILNVAVVTARCQGFNHSLWILIEAP